MLELLSHPVFREAITDIESLGVRVTTEPIAGSIPYAIVGGRSNARWWLLPLTNRKVTISGLALFQPILTSAKLMKHGVTTLSRLGPWPADGQNPDSTYLGLQASRGISVTVS